MTVAFGELDEVTRKRREVQPDTKSWWDELNRFWSGESASVGEKRKKE